MKKILFILLFISSIACAQTSRPRYEDVTVSGTNTYTFTQGAVLPLQDGLTYSVTFTTQNSGASTFNANGTGAKSLVNSDGTSLSSATIKAGQSIDVRYDLGTDKWKLVGGAGGGGITSITTTSPITGGVITTTGSIGIQDAAADGSTKGASTYTASDFNASSGNISIDYTNGQAASGSANGFLSSASWTTFNSKLSALTNGNGTTANGTAVDLGGDLSQTTSLAIHSGTGERYFEIISDLADPTIYTSFQSGIFDDGFSSFAPSTQISSVSGDNGTAISFLPNTLSMSAVSGVIRNGLVVTPTSSAFEKVVNYGSDVSASYTTRSHIDKGYADSRYGIGTASGLTRTNDTNVTLTLGGTPETALLQPASITVGWSGTLAYSRFVSGAGLSVVGRSANTSGVQADIVGTANQVLRVSGTTLGFGAVDLAAMVGATVLPVANGGTNIASYAVGDLLYASAGTTLSKLADVAAGSYLRSGGVTTAPVWSTTTLPNSATTGDIMYASGSNAYANLASVATGSVLGSAGTSTAPAYLAVSNALTATASAIKWGGAMTGPTTVSGSATNTLTLQFDAMGTTITNGAGIYLKNTTAAANGAQQISGITTWEGRGFGTTGSVNQAVAYSMYVLPVQGTTNPSGILNLGYSVNGAALTTGMAMTTAGKTTFTGTTEGLNIDITNGANNVWARFTSAAGVSDYGRFELQANELRYVGGAAGFKLGLTSTSVSTSQSLNPTSFIPAVQHTFGNHTGMTAGTAFPMFQINTGTLTWADGTVASQSLYKMLTPTYNGTTTLATFTEAATLQVDAPTAGAKAAFTNGGNAIYSNGGLRVDGNLRLGTVGNKILIKEGSGGFMGQVALVTGTKAVTVSGVTTSTRCFLTRVIANTTSSTVDYNCACTANTVTITAALAAGTINTADISTMNYILYEPAP